MAAASTPSFHERLAQLEAGHRGTRSELATYASEVVQLRREIRDARAEIQGVREVVDMVHNLAQSNQRQSLQVQRGTRRAQVTAATLGPAVLVLVELGRYIVEHLTH